jgi:DNA-binding NtrC family response regulator
MALAFVIDDDNRQSALYAGILRSNGLEVETFPSADTAAKRLDDAKPGIIVSDVRMPGTDGLSFLRQVRETKPELPFLLVTAFPEVKDAVRALKLGAVDYLEKPVDLDELAAAVMDALRIQNAKAFDPNIPKKLLKDIVAESDAMKVIIRDAFKVAASDATVLLTGPSGAGKEVIANFIHKASTRANQRILALNCAAIPKNILASELFGHKKGAFTGAMNDRKGIFREADGGTLFLDEIGDMPLELQPSLLRAIESGLVSPVGNDLEIPTNIRLIAATNKEIESDVEKGLFREDLFYRLNVISIHIPPLQERPEDILPLAKLFLAQKKLRDARFSGEAAKLLEKHDWPGNARELANAVERAAILSNTDVILPEHLPPAVRRSRNTETPAETASSNAKTMKQAEKDAIKSALATTDGNRTKAAEILGISRRSLIYKIKSYELS